jgi:transposase, IS5 family
MGEERLAGLLALAREPSATPTGAAKPSDFTKVIVDTTVQEKAVAYSTDAKLMRRARERPVRLARKRELAPVL